MFVSVYMYVRVCVCQEISGKWINGNTDNKFKNNISSLFQKDFIRMSF